MEATGDLYWEPQEPAFELQRLRRIFCENSRQQDQRRKRFRIAVSIAIGVLVAIAFFLAAVLTRQRTDTDAVFESLKAAALPSPRPLQDDAETTGVFSSPVQQTPSIPEALSRKAASTDPETAVRQSGQGLVSVLRQQTEATDPESGTLGSASASGTLGPGPVVSPRPASGEPQPLAVASSANATPDESPNAWPGPVQAPGTLEVPVTPQALKPQAEVTNPASSYRLQLSSVRNSQDAAHESSHLAGLYSRELGGASLVVEKADVNGKGTFYRIVTQETRGKEAAERICGELKQKGQTCLVVENREP